MAYTDSSYGLFQGQLFLQERALNGAAISGFEFVGDVDMFAIDPTQKFEDIEESQTGLGLTSAHILVSTSVKAKFRALDIKMSNWIRAVWGGSAPAVAGGSVSGESIVLYNGQMTPLAHPGVSSLVLSTGPAAVVGVDYTVDAVNGSITVLPTSTVIAAGTPQTYNAAYTKAAYTGKVEAFITGQRYYRARLQGRNTAQGNQPVIVTLNQITFDMAKSLSLIDKKHVNFEMDGMLLQDTTVALPQAVTDLSQFFKIVKA